MSSFAGHLIGGRLVFAQQARPIFEVVPKSVKGRPEAIAITLKRHPEARDGEMHAAARQNWFTTRRNAALMRTVATMTFPEDFRVMSEVPDPRESVHTPLITMTDRLNRSDRGTHEDIDLVITKVWATPADNLRVVAVSHGENPDLLICVSGVRDFTALDAGNILSVNAYIRGRGVNVEDTTLSNEIMARPADVVEPGYHYNETPDSAYPARNVPYEFPKQLRGGSYFERTVIADLKNKFKEGKLHTLAYNGWVFDRKKSSILLNQADGLEACLSVDGQSPDQVPCIAEALKHCEWGWTLHSLLNFFMLGGRWTQARTVVLKAKGRGDLRVTVERRKTSSGNATLPYVNGRKISKEDLETVIQAAPCYVGSQEAYDTYVGEVSRISLKFHKWNKDGFKARMPVAGLDAIRRKTAVKTDKSLETECAKVRIPSNLPNDCTERAYSDSVELAFGFSKTKATERGTVSLMERAVRTTDLEALMSIIDVENKRGRYARRNSHIYAGMILPVLTKLHPEAVSVLVGIQPSKHNIGLGQIPFKVHPDFRHGGPETCKGLDLVNNLYGLHALDGSASLPHGHYVPIEGAHQANVDKETLAMLQDASEEGARIRGGVGYFSRQRYVSDGVTYSPLIRYSRWGIRNETEGGTQWHDGTFSWMLAADSCLAEPMFTKDMYARAFRREDIVEQLYRPNHTDSYTTELGTMTRVNTVEQLFGDRELVYGFIWDPSTPDGAHNQATLVTFLEKLGTSNDEALQTRQKALLRSRQFLDETLKAVNAEEVRVPGERGSDKWVFRVTGESGTPYEIDERTGKVSSNGNHICIVRAGGAEIAGYDYISSMLLALAHDSVIADKVNTLPLNRKGR